MTDIAYNAASILEESILGTLIRKSIWMYPAIQALHILGVVLLVGPALLFDLRLLGYARRIRIGILAGYLLPWSRVGLALALTSGSLLFIAHATEWYDHSLFILKISLLVLGGINILVFHKKTSPVIRASDAADPVPTAARITGILSICIWTAIIVLGRFLAYF
jgi:hypothetical protein